MGGDGGTKRKDERRVLTSDSPLSPRKLRIGCPFQSTCPAPRPAPPFCCPILPSLARSLPLYFSTLFALPPHPRIPVGKLQAAAWSASYRFSHSLSLRLFLSRKPNPVVIFYVTRFAMNIDARGIKEGTVFRNWKNFCRAEPAGPRIKGGSRVSSARVSSSSSSSDTFFLSSFFFLSFLHLLSFQRAKKGVFLPFARRRMTTVTRILIN